MNQFNRRVKLPKASWALILLQPIDSAAAVKTAQKYETLKLVEEKDSLFASSVSTSFGNGRVPEHALVAPRPLGARVPSQPVARSSKQESGPVNTRNPVLQGW